MIDIHYDNSGDKTSHNARGGVDNRNIQSTIYNTVKTLSLITSGPQKHEVSSR